VEGHPFFIVGSARSGTTLLRMLLNAHRNIAVPPESRFIVELYDGKDEVDLDNFLARLEKHRQFRAWELPIDAVRERAGRSPLLYRDAISATYEAYAAIRGKSRWGDKTPRYIEHIPLISRLFDGARFIHVVRDGRNVALSYAKVPFGPKTVSRAAALWARRVSSGMRDGGRLGPQSYLEIRYEDVVADLESHARKLCEFIGVEYDEQMLEYTERARADVLPKARHYNPHVMEKPIPSVRQWERDMPTAQVELFEAVAGQVLTQLGYPRAYERPSAKAKLVAALGLPYGRLKEQEGS
jgi:hypothetical protein